MDSIFLTINASDGSYASSPYIWNSNWDTSNSISYSNDKLYFQIECNSISILSVFNIQSESFTIYDLNSSIVTKMMRFSPIINAIIIIGSITSTNKNMYYSSIFPTSISDHPDISISSISVASTSDYVSFDGTFSITDIGSIPLVSNTPVYSQIQISEDTS